MIELTPEQHLALERSSSNAVRAVDPATRAEYVHLRADVYDRIKSILGDSETWPDDAYRGAIEVFARDGWDDPRMEVYDNLDSRRPK